MLLALSLSFVMLTAAPPQPFFELARQVKVGMPRARVRALLGEPHEPREQSADAKQWTYRDPPHRPDGPYHQYTFTFENGKVARVDEAGVGCVYRQ